ncbi:MAG: xanthine dehydrogenase molybdopterin binding subunit [Cohaesibacter sp.]|nr:xanthine dehydrogenase molybdopterin binding subunit [Cohaesibacter sp.]
MTHALKGIAHQAIPHDSAAKHVTGSANYADDIPEPVGTLHAYLGLADQACGEIIALDLSEVQKAPGVVGILQAKDIPGHNDISPTGLKDEPVFATKRVEFWGQPLFAVVAKSRDQARRAAKLAKLDVAKEEPCLTIEEAKKRKQPYVSPPLKLERGEAQDALSAAPKRLQGSFKVGGQDHMYLEGQIAFALPGEDEDVEVYSSTQHPSEVQHMIAHVLGIASHSVTVSVRRMGGGFGGKETQMNLFAVVAALAAKRWNCPVKLRPDRDDDMAITGKRHDFVIDYDLGFDETGKIVALDADFAARCGYSADLSGPVTDRALFHADNAYFYPHVTLRSHPYKTNTVSNTAFRGFGGPQGVIAAERFIEEIAYALNKDPLEIRKANLYPSSESLETGEIVQTKALTPYHQVVEDNILHQLIEELEHSSDYQARRAAIIKNNQTNALIKKGIALTPVKFGISFTATWYNQAGCLLHIYRDGSIQLNHGGTEMGQGLNTKVAQIVAEAFQLDLKRIKITKTTTEKVPNTSATAASSGTDLNGMAALNAANKIKDRLIVFAADHWNVPSTSIDFLPNHVKIGDELIPFASLIEAAYMARIQLSATGFYKTPKIHWDRDKGQGRPFYYFAYGAAVSEVSVDCLTGEYKVERTDILHDVGQSLNPALDKGQVEGAFIQGMGWLTSEELCWDAKGQLRTHAPSTYKIPLASDIPRILNVDLADWSKAKEPTIKRSKAVGEPPFMLAISVFEALSMAVASRADYQICPRLEAPATPERILLAMEELNAKKDAKGAQS